MSDENREPEPVSRPPVELVEERSLDAAIQGAEAIGALTGGLGTLALGVSKLKETFGGGEQDAGASSSDAPAKPDAPASGD